MEKLLTVNQAAHRLGISKRGVMEKIARDELPYCRIGRLVRVSSSQLDLFVHSLTKISAEQAIQNLWTPKDAA